MKQILELIAVKKRGLRAAFLKSLLLWNPLISLVICMFLGEFDHLGRRWMNSYFIASFITTFCFSAVFLAVKLNVLIARFRGKEPLHHSSRWYYSVSLFAMPFGLHVAFQVIALLARLQGWQYDPPNSSDYRVAILIGTLIFGCFALITSRSDAKEAAREADVKVKKIENERLQAQLSAMTAQMNPHLLFNSLNTVASLVATDPQKAEDVIVRLSELYRGVLNSSKNITHSLATEIGICEAYLAIEKARFGERLQTEISIDPNSKQTEIPALCIQPLVENAVKHGIASRSAGGKIWISAYKVDHNLQISIADDGVGFKSTAMSPVKSSGSGTGLRNSRERVNLQYGGAGNFQILPREGGGTIVNLTIPGAV